MRNTAPAVARWTVHQSAIAKMVDRLHREVSRLEKLAKEGKPGAPDVGWDTYTCLTTAAAELRGVVSDLTDAYDSLPESRKVPTRD